ncbi:hypothetical protein H0H93_013149 [Arthromyces matolae]|nr:hypothetical protein H0H93_013149 [Arthromyces matolae]
MLALHPDAKLWTTSLAFENRKLSHCLRPNCWTIHENACLVFRQDPEGDPHADAGGMLPAAEAWASMDPTKRALYDHAKRLFPELANFHFYCEGDELAVVGLRSMDQLMSKPFHHESTTSAPGCLPSDTGVHVPLDAVNTAWGTPVKTFDTGRRKSSRIASRKRTGLKGTSQWSKVTLPDATQSHSDPDNVSRAMLLYAWSRAVELDATYILIRCANYERIGFRHRESQTLYLSDLIHVPTCSDPNYSKLHLGLYLSIIEDVLDRTSQVIQKDPPLANDLPVTVETNAMLNNDKKKRKRNCPDEPTVPAPMRKRPRTRALAAQDEARKVAAEKTLMPSSQYPIPPLHPHPHPHIHNPPPNHPTF